MVRIIVDQTLTPENCITKGFEFQRDTVYDPKAPNIANKEFEELINKGWKLGKSASNKLQRVGGVGIYKPL